MTDVINLNGIDKSLAREVTNSPLNNILTIHMEISHCDYYRGLILDILKNMPLPIGVKINWLMEIDNKEGE